MPNSLLPKNNSRLHKPKLKDFCALLLPFQTTISLKDERFRIRIRGSGPRAGPNPGSNTQAYLNYLENGKRLTCDLMCWATSKLESLLDETRLAKEDAFYRPPRTESEGMAEKGSDGGRRPSLNSPKLTSSPSQVNLRQNRETLEFPPRSRCRNPLWLYFHRHFRP